MDTGTASSLVFCSILGMNVTLMSPYLNVPLCRCDSVPHTLVMQKKTLADWRTPQVHWLRALELAALALFMGTM